MRFNEIADVLFTEEELDSERIIRKTVVLCDEDLIWCDECPYSCSHGCKITDWFHK